MCPSAPENVLPTPVFEGSEKRISVSFVSRNGSSLGAGLRALTRAELDRLMDSAACLIVSARHHAAHDAYVLSESSCFVYPDRIVMKTCGTTRLLCCIPLMLQLAAGLGLEPVAVKYSRASYLFPESQPEEHASFDAETAVLRAAFSSLPLASAYILGDALSDGLQWHVFAAGVKASDPRFARFAVHQPDSTPPLHTLEVCMTGLCPSKASQFFRDERFVDSQSVTLSSGIQGLLPRSEIDDYVFEPCGYSMNAVDGDAFATIHITPEDGFSYASFELCGHDCSEIDVTALVSRVVDVFRPQHAAVAISVDAAAHAELSSSTWAVRKALPPGYSCHAGSFQELRAGGHVAFFSLDKEEDNGDGTLSSATAEDQLVESQKKAGMDMMMMMMTDSAPAVPEPAVPKPRLETSRSSPPSSEESGSPRAMLSSTIGKLLDCSVCTDLDSLGGAVYSEELLLSSGLTISGEPGEESESVAGLRCGGDNTKNISCINNSIIEAYNAARLYNAKQSTLESHAVHLVRHHGLEDTFYVIDLGRVARLVNLWRSALPRVQIHYAVKALPDAGILATLGALGTSFDCASEAEARAVRALGIAPDRIILANACKRVGDLRAGRDMRIPLTTFDSLAELDKICANWPEVKLLLRVRADAPDARCPLGNKFGAEEWEWEALAVRARELGLTIAGVAFHVGSGAGADAAGAYALAVETAARARSVVKAAGHTNVFVLDVGGGFPGGEFGGIAPALNAALDKYWPEASGYRILAEPGRFFAEPAAMLATSVFGKRVRMRNDFSNNSNDMEDDKQQPATNLVHELFVSDGLYGSMNCILYDHASPKPRVLGGNQENLVPTTVFGPTCDGLDTLVRDCPLPASTDVGAWLVWHDMGAYTICGASNFNGMDAVNVPRFYVWSQEEEEGTAASAGY